MKKVWLVLFVLLAAATAQATEPVSCNNLFNLGKTLAPSGATTSYKFSRFFEGFFSVQPVGTITGDLKIEYQTSNDGENWDAPTTITLDAETKERYAFPATGVNIFAGWIRLIFTETGGASSVILTKANLCVQ